MISYYGYATKLAHLTPVCVKTLLYKVRAFWSRPLTTFTVNEQPIFVLGNHKAGTTAIAILLAEMSGASVSTGLKNEMIDPSYAELKQEQKDFSDFVRCNGSDFSKDIIKENHLTFFFDELAEYFEDPRFVFVVRDPRDNIRSILDRMGMPGDPVGNPASGGGKLTPPWKLVLDGRWLGIDGHDYIENLALRWNLATDVYLSHRGSMRLIRYEDFLSDKVLAVKTLCRSLNLPERKSISQLVDIQYQRPGQRNVKWEIFYGTQNLEIIERLCAPRMRELGYSSSTVL